MPYKIPNDEDILRSIMNVMNAVGVVNSQIKLKDLVERELWETDRDYRVSPKRLRILALSSPKIRVEIHYRDSKEKKTGNRCPVCNHELKLVKNKTIFNGIVTVGHECTNCSYWTGMKRRVPTRYIFSLNK
jgi:uncharacterized protein with PIN domain